MAKRIIKFDISDISEDQLKTVGIYKITNTITDNFYIGSASRSFKERFKEHCRYFEQWTKGELKKQHNPILWNSFLKHGVENFKVEILEDLSNKSYQEILQREEDLILELKPVYNICLHPTVGGSPNKGRKLSEEWKENISKKSKEYKHSEEALAKVSKNNKDNANKIELTNSEENLIFSSIKETANYLKITGSAVSNAIKRGKKIKGYSIKVLSKQSKQIKVITEDGDLIFKSFNECDKYFKMWRGYTSTLVQKKSKNLISDKYEYELI